MAQELEGRYTPEFRAYKSCTSMIVNTVKGDLNIADKLLEEGLISDDTYDEVTQSQSILPKTKARKMFSSVREKIKQDVKNFDVFFDILEEESSYYSSLVSKLKGKLVLFSTFTGHLLCTSPSTFCD